MNRYRVRMMDDQLEDLLWWANFSKEVRAAGGTTGGEPGWGSEYEIFTKMLGRHNGHDVHKTAYIEFDTEEDFVIFKLKYS